ncbi:hypothetical protein HB662_01280 [Roseomonas frigidaquae]|uniref:Uncharacterized protein n=1 Tax=Falsiroseomonas frigidaquae TaxID=487318 RepID=A0ABX1ETJ0_9PROT|nr:hypothetical protein [Falsiroseomonas frigidaquae]NKE43392.1 hypothetical protein [Falsiroseomonas frigidaquae]
MAEPTLEELLAWRAELVASIASGVLRSTYMGRTTEFRSLAEMERSKALLDDMIAQAATPTRQRIRRVYTPGAKHL